MATVFFSPSASETHLQAEVIAIEDDDAELQDPENDPRFWTDRQPDAPYEEPSPLTPLDDDDSMSVDQEGDEEDPWPGIPSDTPAHPMYRMMQPVHREDLQVPLANLNLHMLCLIIKLRYVILGRMDARLVSLHLSSTKMLPARRLMFLFFHFGGLGGISFSPNTGLRGLWEEPYPG